MNKENPIIIFQLAATHSEISLLVYRLKYLNQSKVSDGQERGRLDSFATYTYEMSKPSSCGSGLSNSFYLINGPVITTSQRPTTLAIATGTL